MEENKATISFKDFKDDINAKSNEVVGVHWLGQDIFIKRHLSLPEVLAFVSNVVDVCYQGEGDALVYTPEVQAYAIQHSLVSFYTNIDISEPESGEDDDFGAYDFVTRSDIVDLILKTIDHNQYESIIKAIASKIKYINEQNSAAVMSEMSTLNSTINEILPQISELFNDGNTDKMKSVIDALQVFNEDATIRRLAMEQIKNG